ncbi:MAG: hypothetical protein RR838_12525, partial [Clostridium sp.]
MKNKLFWTIIIFTSAIVACLLIVINYKDNDYTRETTLNSIYSVKPTNIKLNINYEYKENNNQTQAKVYTSVKDLKSELSIKLLNTSYFKNYESLLIKNKDYCEIYIIPNGTTKNYS